jgi:myxalamid-type polyketide synthase MxaE and MxaD
MTEKQPPEKTDDPVAGAYDLTSSLYFGHLKETLAAQYLTFPPFPEPVEGFSWLLIFNEPHLHPEETELMLKRQAEMRNLLFSSVDFAAINQVLDIGCGHGSDLIQLGKRFDHLLCDGYTVSPRQFELCAKRILNSGLERRVHVFLRDSAQDLFPQAYDFMFGIEVAHHIENKAGLFSNMAGHLKDAGVIVLADVLSNTGFDLLQPDKGSFSISKENYALLLGKSGLELTACTELTKEIANFLYDPNFEKNLAELNQRNPETRSLNEMHRDFNNVGTALKRGFICYLLLTIRKARKGLKSGKLTGQNLECLNNPISYREALDAFESRRQANSPSP